MYGPKFKAMKLTQEVQTARNRKGGGGSTALKKRERGKSHREVLRD